MRNLKRIERAITHHSTDDEYKPLTDELGRIRLICEREYIPIIRRDTEYALLKLTDLIKPSRILEIGTCIGYSALFFANLCDAEIYSIERDPFAYEAARVNLSNTRAGSGVNLILGDGKKKLMELKKKGIGDFDIIFIDGGKSHYEEFFEIATTLVSQDGVIVSDDVWQRGIALQNDSNMLRKHRTSGSSMKRYIELLKNHSRFETAFFEIGDGLAISVPRK